MNMLETLIRGLFVHIDQSNWSMKTIKDLIKEIEEGDCILQLINGQLTRVVSVGYIEIFNQGKRLVEISQIWPNGQVKYRNQPVAGKLRFFEDSEAEMLREIEEELGIPMMVLKGQDIKLDHKVIKNGESPYYPGVPAVWHENHFVWHMPDDLVKSSYTEDDGRKITIFEWVDL
jgi:hypothetical protein